MRVEEPENGFKDFILNLTKAYSILKRNILLIIVVSLLFSAISALYAKHFKPSTYLSSSSFIMEGKQDNSGMGIMNLASQFGVGGTGGSGIDENKLIFIFQTRKIIEAALATFKLSVFLNGQNLGIVSFVSRKEFRFSEIPLASLPNTNTPEFGRLVA